ncbi:electron transfer flavoprotein subunit alpha/FixB family protein [Armatimonas sp.]|uniref:electron transfer flavoprotein subunit alpha/FixB family protein n=1 Tax=Armatimonas sp. TaxID=1872638 RepID=UPI00374D6A2C
MKLLVLGETPQTLTFAQHWAAVTGGSFVVLAAASITADALVAAMKSEHCDSLVGAATSLGRDVLPRVAALLDLPMLSDVLSVESHEGRLTLTRPMYAGNVVARVRTTGDIGVYSVRSAAFGQPEPGAPEPIAAAALPRTGYEVLSLDAPEQTRPELTQARVVVSGGRPTRDAATFEKLIGGLADALGGAAGATRAAVDAEIAPNELQVGQTGKVVAPELYIAAGISGSIQHLAGMKDSKVIVAINTDPDAPIFEVADYGLVADIHQAIPELIGKL